MKKKSPYFREICYYPPVSGVFRKTIFFKIEFAFMLVRIFFFFGGGEVVICVFFHFKFLSSGHI